MTLSLIPLLVLLADLSNIDIHKIFIDELSDSGRGPAYDCYDIDSSKGAAVVVRPDHCKLISSKLCVLLVLAFRSVTDDVDISMITAPEDLSGLTRFFSRWAITQSP